MDHNDIAVRTHEAMYRALLEKDPEGLKAWLLKIKQAARIITPLLEGPKDAGKRKALRRATPRDCRQGTDVPMTRLGF